MSVPYVLVYFLPLTTNADLRMKYAGAVEQFRNTAEVAKVIQIAEADELEEIEARLNGES